MGSIFVDYDWLKEIKMFFHYYSKPTEKPRRLATMMHYYVSYTAVVLPLNSPIVHLHAKFECEVPEG